MTRSWWQDTASQKPENFVACGVALTGHDTAVVDRSSVVAVNAFPAGPRLLPGTGSQ